MNRLLTIRNWLIGYYIVEFEQKGEDRAAYGTQLREKIAEKIKIKGLTASELSRCRQFYYAYPQILGLITQELSFLLPKNIIGLPTQQYDKPNEDVDTHLSRKLQNCQEYWRACFNFSRCLVVNLKTVL